jgi:hypothetical protein
MGDTKKPYIKVGFEVWYYAPNAEAAEQLLNDSLRADMDTWTDWLTIETEEVDVPRGIDDWVWEQLSKPCPNMDEDGDHKVIPCELCCGDEEHVPGWQEPEGIPDAMTTASAQGWNEESLNIHAFGFINDQGLAEEFEAYLAECAREENEQI